MQTVDIVRLKAKIDNKNKILICSRINMFTKIKVSVPFLPFSYEYGIFGNTRVKLGDPAEFRCNFTEFRCNFTEFFNSAGIELRNAVKFRGISFNTEFRKSEFCRNCFSTE